MTIRARNIAFECNPAGNGPVKVSHLDRQSPMPPICGEQPADIRECRKCNDGKSCDDAQTGPCFDARLMELQYGRLGMPAVIAGAAGHDTTEL